MGLSIVAGMRNLRLGITVVALSVLSLVVMRLVPSSLFENIRFANSIAIDFTFGIIFYAATYFLGLQTLHYFRMPTFGFRSMIALVFASFFVVAEITGSDNIHLSTQDTVLGIIFLLGTGFSEEMFSRAFTFGVLYKLGRAKAIAISSLLFGLMHLNLYLGSDWNPWRAYWHVVDAAAFGVFICALMIVTRSVWVGVIFHALVDWSLVFDKHAAPLPKAEQWHPAFWEGLKMPLSNAVIYIGLAALMLQIDRGVIPAWVHRVALRWKLVEPTFGGLTH